MARSATAKRLLRSRPKPLWSWILLGCILIFFAAIRFRLRDMPLERDEGEFAYGGQLLLQGVWPGQALYTMKLPGTHAVYAVLMILFGQNATGVHLGFAIVNALTIFLLFFLAQALLGDIAACTTAATYGLLSLSPDILGTSAHATHFVMLFAIGGLLLLWHAQRTGRLTTYLAGGFLLGCSVLMKHSGVAFVALGLLWVAWLKFLKRPGSNPPTWRPIIFVVIGSVLPLTLLLLIFWIGGTFENYWFWAVTYAQAYAKPNPGATLVWLSLMQRMPVSLQFPFYASLAALAALWLTRESRTVALLSTAFLFFSLLAIIPGLHFRQHYYVVLIPVIALLTGALIQKTTEILVARARFLVVIPLAIFAGFFAEGIVTNQNFFFRMTPVDACRSLYGFQPFPEAMALANYIQEHSNPGARIVVLGSEPEIYFYARRHSATGYVYTYPLAEKQPYARQMREQMLREIDAGRPQFIVQVRSWTSWLSRPGAQNRIDEICDQLMPTDYKPIALCEFFPEESRTVWHWPPAKLPDMRNPSSQLLLFERAIPNSEAQIDNPANASIPNWGF